MDTNSFSINFFPISLVILIIFTFGDPDLLDAFINFFNSIANYYDKV